MLKAIVLLSLVSAVGAHAADSFEFSVFRDHLPRKEAGRLRISDDGVSFQSANQKTKIDVPLLNIFQVDVSDPKVIRIETYDILKQKLLGRQVHAFRLVNSVHDDALARFLSKALPRPVIGAFGPAPQPEAVIRAYHRHRLGGCHGTIRIDSDSIRFLSDRPEDSRTWLYRDLAAIGTMNPFHFRVSTLAETFNFDLKERLSETAYDLAARRVYSLPSTSAARLE
ncbi:MAG: hypothetical protein J0H49_03020 [Acidobacteria bacterium]|nr:hypothetical protein [Acidobacteriota bacterium]